MAIPPPPAALSGFPAHAIKRDAVLWRVHRSGEPWLFSPAGSGRFDLKTPRGTCYAALERLGAFVEHFGRILTPGLAVPLSTLRLRTLSRLTIRQDLRLADLTARRGLGPFGVTGEIAAATDYDRTRAWAEALAGAGFDGILYRARHDPSADFRSVALLGVAGVHQLGDADSERLPTDLILDAIREFGIAVAPATLAP